MCNLCHVTEVFLLHKTYISIIPAQHLLVTTIIILGSIIIKTIFPSLGLKSNSFPESYRRLPKHIFKKKIQALLFVTLETLDSYADTSTLISEIKRHFLKRHLLTTLLIILGSIIIRTIFPSLGLKSGTAFSKAIEDYQSTYSKRKFKHYYF